MRSYGLSETLVCTLQRFLFYETFVHNDRYVNETIQLDGTISITTLKSHKSEGVPRLNNNWKRHVQITPAGHCQRCAM